MGKTLCAFVAISISNLMFAFEKAPRMFDSIKGHGLAIKVCVYVYKLCGRSSFGKYETSPWQRLRSEISNFFAWFLNLTKYLQNFSKTNYLSLAFERNIKNPINYKN